MAKIQKRAVRAITKSDAESIVTRAKRGQYKRALEELAEIKGEIITPHDVLDAARDEDSPLHSWFDWNDNEAAEKYRLMQARILLTNVRVEIKGQKTRGYLNARVYVDNEQTRAYFPVERVMNDKDLHEAVLRDAVRELEHAEMKYKTLSELRGVINTKRLREVKAKLT